MDSVSQCTPPHLRNGHHQVCGVRTQFWNPISNSSYHQGPHLNAIPDWYHSTLLNTGWWCPSQLLPHTSNLFDCVHQHFQRSWPLNVTIDLTSQNPFKVHLFPLHSWSNVCGDDNVKESTHEAMARYIFIYLSLAHKLLFQLKSVQNPNLLETTPVWIFILTKWCWHIKIKLLIDVHYRLGSLVDILWRYLSYKSQSLAESL